jgi:alanine-glyoxylate transaminase/serine-glyoxylate transaminase/serine-pyruvate transaminase
MTQNPVFIPGPTNIPDRLRRAMDIQTMDHRAPGFGDVLKPILEECRSIFGTARGTVIPFPASGTGAWEAALTNTLSPGDRVLIARYGMFSDKWIDMCERFGLDVQVINCVWGTGAPAEIFAERLAEDTGHKIKAVLVTHNETATGVVSDLAKVRRAIDAAGHPALLYVDGVSSIGSMPFEMDLWGVDIAITGSQKGLMLYTGLAICCVSDKALTRMETATLPRTVFDFRDMMTANGAGSFPYTPAMQLVMGLRESLAMLKEEGLEAVFTRHTRLAEGVRAAVEAWGLTLCARAPELYSDTVTTVMVPEGVDANAIVERAYTAYGTSFGGGLGPLAGRAFRIGHLGMLTEGMVLQGLATIEMAMRDYGVEISLGSGVAAAQAVFCAPVAADTAVAIAAE